MHRYFGTRESRESCVPIHARLRAQDLRDLRLLDRSRDERARLSGHGDTVRAGRKGARNTVVRHNRRRYQSSKERRRGYREASTTY